MIPVTVLTGFLGSGKTTLLARLLRDPGLARTAVIVNEFGEIGIDHDLVAASDEDLLLLATGCLCCRVRGDLVRTLHDLATRRAAGSIAAFDRVVIETSGLADPASILQALMTDAAVGEVYELHNVVTTIDTVLGTATLPLHAQAVRQVAIADVLVLTKSDLPTARLAETQRAATALNPSALVRVASFGDIAPSALLEGQRLGAIERMMHLGLHPPGRHGVVGDTDTIRSVCYLREAPTSAVALALFLQALAEHCGAGLLRMKGIVQVRENPGHPAVIHGVQHVFHPPEWLDGWPSADRRTRIVFIGGNPPSPGWVGGLLDILELEVADEAARHAGRTD